MSTLSADPFPSCPAGWAGGNRPIAVSWSPVSDFWRQVLLSVIDKGLLGGAALGVGYFVNVRLERFRARRALEGEFLRERTRRLDELYVAMLEADSTATTYVGLEMGWIEFNKHNPAPHMRQRTSENIDAGAKFQIASGTLARKSAHYRPWIGDRLHAACTEYGRIVAKGVLEQTIPGSHDIDRIHQLAQRTKQLQAQIMAAIREGAPETVTAEVSGERVGARPLAPAPSPERKRLGAGERS